MIYLHRKSAWLYHATNFEIDVKSLLPIYVLGAIAAPGTYSQIHAIDGVTCLYGTALDDGCLGAQPNGVKPYQNLADYQRVIFVNVVSGHGYVDGAGYVWVSSGGGCSVNATGTIDVSGGALANGVVVNEGAGCAARPMILVPPEAGGGSGGRIIPTVYQLTPHNAPITYNLPGIDYNVGYDSRLTLKDPTARGTLPPCASYSVNTVTINSNHCTLSGFDFALHDTNLMVAANLSRTVITNNNFKANSNALDSIHLSPGSCDATIKYNQFNGAALKGIGSGYNITASINSLCYSGQITIEYNYCFNVDSKCVNFGGAPTSSSILRVTEQYNVYAEIGLCRTCAHGEAEYSYSGFTSGTVYETISPWIMKFNVAFTHYYNAPTLATSEMAIEADAVNIANADVEYNYSLAPGPWAAIGANNSSRSPVTASASIYCGQQENGTNSQGTMGHNLLDYTGAYFPYNQSGGTCKASFPFISDLNAVTGHSCNASTCN